MKLIDSHAHIHGDYYELDAEIVLSNAQSAGIEKIVCVGVDDKDSAQAVEFAQKHSGVWASVGLHPHDAKLSEGSLKTISELANAEKVVAIGEIGLDYYYEHSPQNLQKDALRAQLKIAKDKDLPVIFHIRGSKNNPSDAFVDAFSILDEFSAINGVVHSFTAHKNELEMCLSRNLYVAINGIITFSKDEKQIEAVKLIPDNKLLIETDTPYLTPTPKRGKINQPKYVELVADKISEIRGTSKTKIAQITTVNAETLFNI